MPNTLSLSQRFAGRPDYHQLVSYGKVMEEIGWQTVKLRSGLLFIRRLGPISFAKMQRPGKVELDEILETQRRYRIVRLVLEPGLLTQVSSLEAGGFKSGNNHYAYTKTLVVDLSGTISQILASFSKTTSYQMRRSQKMGVDYKQVAFSKLSETDKLEILKLHTNWSQEKKVAGYDDAFLRAMWKHVSQGTMILAYKAGELHGALFLIVHHKLGMYFYQFSSLSARNDLYIPSGLSYRAILLCKQLGCDLFDLCSAYDERYGKENLKWQGFSAHKERYHPTPIYYPPSLVRHHLPFFTVK